MIEKTLKERIEDCKEIIIQGMESSLKINMIWYYFERLKMNTNEIKTINQFKFPNNGFCIEFVSHAKAMNFYNNANFKDKILVRPFNLSLKIRLNEDETQKYNFDGLTQDNRRLLFEACRKIDICKIKVKCYENTKRIEPFGTISFIRKEELSEAELRSLEVDLAPAKIKISKAKAQGASLTIEVINFYHGDLEKLQEEIIQDGKKQLLALINPFVSNPDKLDVRIRSNQTQNKFLVAQFQYNDAEENYRHFQTLRKAMIRKNDIKVIIKKKDKEKQWNFSCLFAMNIIKPKQNQEMKQFQDQFLQVLRKVNPNVIQVLVFPMKLQGLHIAKLLLKDIDSGCNFILFYQKFRKELSPFFANNNFISFDVNVNAKQLKRYRMSQKEGKNIPFNLKKDLDYSQRIRVENKMAVGGNPQFQHSLMRQDLKKPGFQTPLPQAQITGFYGQAPPVRSFLSIHEIKTRLLKEKDQSLKMDLVKLKKVAIDIIKDYLLNAIKLPQNQITNHAVKILDDCTTNEAVIKYIEFPEEIKKKIIKQ